MPPFCLVEEIFKLQNTKLGQRCKCALLLPNDNTQLHWSDIILHHFHPKCYSAWNSAENECVDISQCLCLLFQNAELQEQLAAAAKKTELSACEGAKCPCLWEQRAPNLKPLLIRTRNLLLPWENLCATRRGGGKKGKKKTKTACGRLGVVGHVMQTPLHQWVGVETFNCADGRLKFLGLWRESQKHSVLNCDSAAASNSRVHLSPKSL